jgi:hypothetical protein
MLPALCGGRYQLVVDDRGLPDQEMILTDLQILDEAYVELAGAPIWSAHWVRLKTGLGTVDIVATHFASSSFNLECLESGWRAATRHVPRATTMEPVIPARCWPS